MAFMHWSALSAHGLKVQWLADLRLFIWKWIKRVVSKEESADHRWLNEGRLEIFLAIRFAMSIIQINEGVKMTDDNEQLIESAIMPWCIYNNKNL